jgi:hypothetical protein
MLDRAGRRILAPSCADRLPAVGRRMKAQFSGPRGPASGASSRSDALTFNPGHPNRADDAVVHILRQRLGEQSHDEEQRN